MSEMGSSAKRYRHRKRGTTYVVIYAVAHLEKDHTPVTVYRSEEDGTIWVRPAREFWDGRFEPIDCARDVMQWYERVPANRRYTVDVLNGGLREDKDGPWVIRGAVDAALDAIVRGQPTQDDGVKDMETAAGQLRALARNDLVASAPLAVSVLNDAANKLDEAAARLVALRERVDCCRPVLDEADVALSTLRKLVSAAKDGKRE